jgi:hypothetical protein
MSQSTFSTVNQNDSPGISISMPDELFDKFFEDIPLESLVNQVWSITGNSSLKNKISDQDALDFFKIAYGNDFEKPLPNGNRINIKDGSLSLTTNEPFNYNNWVQGFEAAEDSEEIESEIDDTSEIESEAESFQGYPGSDESEENVAVQSATQSSTQNPGKKPKPIKLYISHSCALCLKDYEFKVDSIVSLKCGHIFHGECCETLVRKKCPVCRKKF